MKQTLTIAGLLGATALIAKSMVGHGPDASATYEAVLTAADLQLLHAIGLAALSLLYAQFSRATTVASIFVAGTVLFCLPIYLTYLAGAPRFIIYFTPVGGVLLIAGWLGLAIIPWLPRQNKANKQ